MTVEESNKMIAEFMGAKIMEGSEPVLHYFETPPLHYTKHQGNLFYHTSWDWLMPVVEKIMPLHKQFGNCNGFYYFDSIKDNLAKVNINAVYSAVTQFLTYINEKK